MKEKRINLIIQNYLYLFVYALIALVVLGPLLKPGYIFLLDSVFGPHYKIDFSSAVVSGFPLRMIVYGLTRVTPAWFAPKLLIFLCLFLSGACMHGIVPVRFAGVRYFAGVVYMVNPFVFTRLQAGHFGLLLAYALTPLAVASFIKFAKAPAARNGVWAGCWIAGLALLDLHSLYLLMPFGLLVVINWWFNSERKDYARRAAKGLAWSALSFFAVSAFWLGPAFAAKSPVGGIEGNQLADFATRGDPLFGLYFNVAALNGFWQNQIFETKSALTFWPVIFLFLFALSVFGLYQGLKDHQKRAAVAVIGITAIAGFVLALGTSSPFTSGLYRFLFDNVPVFRGFREPQKFIALLAFSYAYLGAVGLDDIVARIRSREDVWPYARFVSGLAVCFAVVLAFIYAYPMFWGLTGHVKLTDYPASWYSAEKTMAADKTEGRALFLPWHEYMSLKFNDQTKVVANPAEHFFSRDVISGKNMELGKVYTISIDPVQRRVEEILADGRKDKDVSGELKSLNIRYVVLAKEADWWKYKWLYGQRWLQKVYETPEIVLFRVT